MVLYVASPNINIITIISCITNDPILNLPEVVSSSSLSARILRTTIVLLNENQIPIYATVIISNHNNIDTPQPTNEDNNTCKIAEIIDDAAKSIPFHYS